MKHRLNKVSDYPEEFDYKISPNEIILLTNTLVKPHDGQKRDNYKYLEDTPMNNEMIDVEMTELLDRLFWVFKHSHGGFFDEKGRCMKFLMKMIDEFDLFIEEEQGR